MKRLLFLSALLLPCLTQAQTWKPVPDKMLTAWGRTLAPETAWTEYPRPQMERTSWQNLNGLWDYAITPASQATPPSAWNGSILVPFAPEATLSGVGRPLEPDQILWYKRVLPAAGRPGLSTLLHFGAVDYKTTVWVNGIQVGVHTGGNVPFSFDITDALKPADNTLLVRVTDATNAPGSFQLRGKQHLKAGGIFYTRVSGIWQTVWTEQVPARSFARLDYTSDIKADSVTFAPSLRGQPLPGERIRIVASFGGKEVARAEGLVSSSLVLTIPDARLWSPATPNLYDVEVALLDGQGNPVDTVKSYVALRALGKTRDAAGNLRFTLNGKPIFHWGTLDQGWWPDGLLTPPSDQAMLSDLQFLKAAGFNMLRKHIKVEPARYYYHCDQLGLMVWQDQVSGDPGPKWTRLEPDPKDADWPEAAHQEWVAEYKAMVDHLRFFPSIVEWTPFNEAWGQHRSMDIGKLAVAYDPTRPINIASGGNFWPVGDIVDDHSYPDPSFAFDDTRFKDYIKVVGEFGGHPWPVEGHLWVTGKKNFGYGEVPKSIDEWKARYAQSITRLIALRAQGISAGVYTQTSDVESEINGLLTYDRIPKVDAAWLKTQADRLLNAPDTARAK